MDFILVEFKMKISINLKRLMEIIKNLPRKASDFTIALLDRLSLLLHK